MKAREWKCFSETGQWEWNPLLAAQLPTGVRSPEALLPSPRLADSGPKGGGGTTAG